jgi:hypothetical protein
VCAKGCMEHFTGFSPSARSIGDGLRDADDLIALRAPAEVVTSAIHFVLWPKPSHFRQFWIFHELQPGRSPSIPCACRIQQAKLEQIASFVNGVTALIGFRSFERNRLSADTADGKLKGVSGVHCCLRRDCLHDTCQMRHIVRFTPRQCHPRTSRANVAEPMIHSESQGWKKCLTPVSPSLAPVA